MLNRVIFLYSFSIASIIGVSFMVGYVTHLVNGLFEYMLWLAFIGFIWWVIPAPRWMVPFLKAMQTAKITGTINKEQLSAAIKAGMNEVIR